MTHLPQTRPETTNNWVQSKAANFMEQQNITMEGLHLIFISLTFCAALTLLFHLAGTSKKNRLPPGPLAVPLLGNPFWLRRSIEDLEIILGELHAKYGPIVTLRIGSGPSIFIADRNLAHKALVEHGTAFSDRPKPLPAFSFLSSNQHNITDSGYGPLWRLLRRNLISEILHPSRIKIYDSGRRWVLGILAEHLQSIQAADGAVVVMESFQFAMFCLLVLMCFGEKLDQKAIVDIEVAERALLLSSTKRNFFAFVPRVFRKWWMTVVELRQRLMDLYVPLIQARREHKRSPNLDEEKRYVYSYVDSLLDIKLQEEGGRGLTDDEIVTLCSEFLSAGTDTTSTALQWIMANLVKNLDIQMKLVDEINSVVGSEVEEVREENLSMMPYLKAVIKEGLRRHPPGHFVLPHAVSEEVTLGGYVIPKEASVNFEVAKINLDGEVWEEPMEFRPERFLVGGEGCEVDITGSREIKMMPFGAGRRICPAIGLATLHLEYFVANLVREFEWKKVEGEEVDMSEKWEFSVVMKNSLRAYVIPRRKL